MKTYSVQTFLRFVLIGAVSQLAACVYAALPPSATTSVGKSSNIVCRAPDVQVCREHGVALKCTCTDSFVLMPQLYR